jgi:ATP-binding cassette subfamily B (MDR/TAP) protein 1
MCASSGAKESAIDSKDVILKDAAAPEEVPSATPPGTIKDLVSTADGYDYFCMFMGTVGGIIVGVSIPAFLVLFGEALDGLNETTNLQKQINEICVYFVYIGVANIFGGFAQVYFWTVTGERQTQKLRAKYVRAILSQEVGWFDTCGAGQLATKVADFGSKLQDGTGRKIGDCIQYICQILGSLVVGFYLQWKLTLVLLCCIPFIGAAGAYMVNAVSSAMNATGEQYAAAGMYV